jgi:hypothetical protein
MLFVTFDVPKVSGQDKTILVGTWHTWMPWGAAGHR